MMKEQVLPQIKPSKGSERLYNLDLCFLEDEQQQPPKITFRLPNDESVTNLDDVAMTGAELVRHSFKNLSEIELSVQDGSKVGENVLLFNKPYAAEKVLDKQFTKEVAEALHTDRMLVSMPARDALIVCPEGDQEASEQLARQTQKIYNDFTKESISLLIFTMEDGSILSAETPSVKFHPTDEEQVSFGSYQADLSKVKLFEALYNYRIIASAEKVEDLQNGLFHSIFGLLDKTKRDTNFQRTIDIIGSAQTIKKDSETIACVQNLFDKIAQVYMAEFGSSGQEAIKLSFQFHEDFQNGNSHNKITKHLN